jgi:hypothetical protein
MPRRIATLALLFPLIGCADVSFSSGDGGVLDRGAESPFPATDYGPRGDGTYTCSDVIDVVFVLDVSSSMTFVLDTLDKEIGLVVDASNKLQPNSHFGIIGFVDNHLLDTTGDLEGGRVHTTAATLQKAFRSFKQLYTGPNRNPGDGPGGPTQQNPICEENACDALHAGASDFPWRAFATRVVVVVTDDTFLERPDNYGDRDGDGKTDRKDYPAEGDYPARFTMAESVAALKSATARVFSFTRLKEPGLFDLTRCGTGRRLPWASIAGGWSAPYNGQPPFPEQTGGQNFDLDQVYLGKLSLTATINNVVLESHCKPID